MAECINREKILEDIGTDIAAFTLSMVFRHIHNAPPADVAEVICGRWEEVDWVEPDGHGFGTVRTPKAGLRCNQCSNVFKKELLWKRNYCPACSAKMDLED